MAAIRFCEECGKPLNPGTKFCEECGAAVHPEPGTPVPPAQTRYTEPDIPLAVIPFGSQPRGIFSRDRCTIVIYPDQVVLSYVPKDQEEEFGDADEEVGDAIIKKDIEGKKFWEMVYPVAGILRASFIPEGWNLVPNPRDQGIIQKITPRVRPWERYLSMAPGVALAEDRRNIAIPRDSISYIRGDAEGDSGIIIIATKTGSIRIYLDHGIYTLARLALFSFLEPGDGTAERITGGIPWADEPQVQDFSYQYVWEIIVTDRRIWFTSGGDEGEEDTRPSLEETVKGPVSALLEYQANFFIPLGAINSVKIVPAGKRDLISFELPGETLSMKLEKGTADRARSVLGPVLPGKV